MIDTDKYEGHTDGPWTWRGETIDGDGEVNHTVCYMEHPHVNGGMNEANARLIADAPLLLEEVMRLREENETLRKMDWEYECLWTWLAENTNLLNTIEPLMEEWKKEMIE